MNKVIYKTITIEGKLASVDSRDEEYFKFLFEDHDAIFLVEKECITDKNFLDQLSSMPLRITARSIINFNNSTIIENTDNILANANKVAQPMTNDAQEEAKIKIREEIRRKKELEEIEEKVSSTE